MELTGVIVCLCCLVHVPSFLLPHQVRPGKPWACSSMLIQVSSPPRPSQRCSIRPCLGRGAATHRMLASASAWVPIGTPSTTSCTFLPMSCLAMARHGTLQTWSAPMAHRCVRAAGQPSAGLLAAQAQAPLALKANVLVTSWPHEIDLYLPAASRRRTMCALAQHVVIKPMLLCAAGRLLIAGCSLEACHKGKPVSHDRLRLQPQRRCSQALWLRTMPSALAGCAVRS